MVDFFAKHPKGLKPCFCEGPEGWVLQLPPPHGVRAGAAWHEAGTPRAGITDLTTCPVLGSPCTVLSFFWEGHHPPGRRRRRRTGEEEGKEKKNPHKNVFITGNVS